MKKTRVAVCLIALFLIVGCSIGSVLQPTKDLSQYYVLTPIDEASRGVPITYSSGGVHKTLSIGLGPVKLPAYLARPEIVTRSSPNLLDLSDKDRWAEPLDKNFVNVLGQNLTTLLGAHVVTFPGTGLSISITKSPMRYRASIPIRTVLRSSKVDGKSKTPIPAKC